jgi:hypothetical protein
MEAREFLESKGYLGGGVYKISTGRLIDLLMEYKKDSKHPNTVHNCIGCGQNIFKCKCFNNERARSKNM